MRRLCLFMADLREEICPGCDGKFLFLLDIDVLPSHLHTAAGVNLEGNDAIVKFRRGIPVVRDLNSVQMDYDVITRDRGLKIIPFARLERPLTLGRGHCNPAASATFIQPAGVFADARIHLHLHPFDIRAVLRIGASNPRVKKKAAIAVRFALELQAQIEVAIGLLGCQIAVFIGRAFAQDRSLFDTPSFISVLLPTREVLAVEKRQPPAFRRRLNCYRERDQQPGCDKHTTLFHDKPPSPFGGQLRSPVSRATAAGSLVEKAARVLLIRGLERQLQPTLSSWTSAWPNGKPLPNPATAIAVSQ